MSDLSKLKLDNSIRTEVDFVQQNSFANGFSHFSYRFVTNAIKREKDDARFTVRGLH